ncbi:MAG: hypothetical protein ACK4PR_07270 [Gammaproteobacteria bacterium]
MQLKKRIQECDSELKKSYIQYAHSKREVIADITQLKKKLPMFNAIISISVMILTFSPTVRNRLGKMNKNLLLGLVNVKLGINTVHMVMNFSHHIYKFFSSWFMHESK